MPPPYDPVQVVRRLGGRAQLDDLTRWTTRARLRTAVRRGRLVRAARGIYVLPAVPATALAAARSRGVLSHASAATSWGLSQVAEPARIHVTVRPGARPAALEGVQIHWSRLGDGDVVDGVTSPLRTVLDCATVLPFVEALAIADSALAYSFLRREELAEAAAASPRRGRARRVRVAGAADRRSENAFESALRGILLEGGVTGLQPQLPIPVGRRTLHVDLGDPARRLALEADSFEHHGTRQALVRDCERYDELVAEGWRVLRFAYEQVMFRPEWVTAVVRATLGRVDDLP